MLDPSPTIQSDSNKNLRSVFGADVRLILLSCLIVMPVLAVSAPEKGLIGVYFSGSDRSNPKGIESIDFLDLNWHEREIGYRDWAAEWRGFLIGPTDGPVRLVVETNRRAYLEIDGERIIDVTEATRGSGGTVLAMKRGEKKPIRVGFTKSPGKGPVFLKISWAWQDHPSTPIGTESLEYLPAQIDSIRREYPTLIEPPGRPAELVTAVTHVVVYYEPGRFAAWPANNGIWLWGNEILVGFTRGYYKKSNLSHSFDPAKPLTRALARSQDGGNTWELELPNSLEKGDSEPTACTEPIDFSHPRFALQCRNDFFRVSYDRGRSWSRALKLIEMELDLTSRTDYLVSSASDCHLFLSAKQETPDSAGQDRAFCARTTDGGKTIRFVSWITGEPLSVRSVMPSTVRLSEKKILTTLRRKQKGKPEQGVRTANWIDAYVSEDNGKTWRFLSRVTETDTGKHNGNPPSLVRLPDGRLVVTYGYRATPYGIRARISLNEGETWGPEIEIRGDALTWDLGYTRSVVRPDGKVVTVYYITTPDRPEEHLAVTIWDPDEVRPSKDNLGNCLDGVESWNR